MSDAMKRVTWRGRTFNLRTVAMIEAVERKVGFEIPISQGSYSTTVEASGGTHDGGGAVDWGSTSPEVVLAARQVGFAAWLRDPTQGPWPWHIHAIAIGDSDLASLAASQVTSYRSGRNGLASNGLDNGPKVRPIPQFRYPPEDDMPDFNDAIPLAEGKTLGDAQRAALRTETKVDRLLERLTEFRGKAAERDAKLADRLTEIDADLGELSESTPDTATKKQVIKLRKKVVAAVRESRADK